MKILLLIILVAFIKYLADSYILQIQIWYNLARLI